MTNAAVVRPLPGPGLVARAGDLLLVCADGEHEVDDLLGLVAEVAAAGGDGGVLVRRVAALLAADFDGRFPACAASGPTRDGKLAVLVYGAATADVVSGDGDVSLAGSDAITSVNRLINGPITAIRLQLPGAGPANLRSRLDAGVVAAAGVLYSAGATGPAAPPVSAAAATPSYGLLSSAEGGAAMPPPSTPAGGPSPYHHAPVGEAASPFGTAPDPQPDPQPGPSFGASPEPPASAAGAAPQPSPSAVGAAPSPESSFGPAPQPSMMDSASAHPFGKPEPLMQPEPAVALAPQSDQMPVGLPMPPPPAPLVPAAPPMPSPMPPPSSIPPAPVAPAPPPSGPPAPPPYVMPLPPVHVDPLVAPPPPPPPPPPAAPAPSDWPSLSPGIPSPSAQPASAQPAPPADGPKLRQPDPAAPFVAVLLLPGTDGVDLAEPPAPEVDPRPKVLGVLCKNDHFNDPNLRYCSVCGISMAQQTLVKHEGPRPPLGVLLLDDGSTFRLDMDYIVGREPQADPEVISGTVRPLRITDTDGVVSRRHLRVALVGWDVTVVDLGSANGTNVTLPGDPQRHQLAANQPIVVRPGTQVTMGRRWFRYESHRNP